MSRKSFTGNEKFPGNIYLKPEESPEDGEFYIVNNVMSPYDLYEILSGFSFLVSNFSNLSIVNSSDYYQQRMVHERVFMYAIIITHHA